MFTKNGVRASALVSLFLALMTFARLAIAWLRWTFDPMRPAVSIAIGELRSLRRGRVLDDEHDRRTQRRAARRERADRVEEEKEIAIGEKCGVHGMAIGQCGCAVAAPMAAVMAPVTTSAAGAVADSAAAMIPASLLCRPGSYPEGGSVFGWRDALRNSRMTRAPYVDPAMDAIEMDTLYSEIFTALPGVPIDLEVSPVTGRFVAAYWEIVAVDPTTQVEQVDWTAGQPRIEGCPVPCQTGDEEALAQFVMKVPEACCGQPGLFWLDKRSEDSPLVVPFTNQQASGNLSVQIRLRGYCCSTKIC